MNEKRQPYFPPSYGMPECGKCERENCMSKGKYQRNRTDFSYTSGRCPRLPDRRGFVYQEDRELYAKTFPLVHAERGEEDTLYLTLTQPGKRSLKVNMTWGCWWIRDKEDGKPVRRIVRIGSNLYKRGILDEMGSADYCIFRCEVGPDCI